MTIMKKILVAAALLFAGMTTTFAADRERPTTVGKLPAAAQQFLDTHFKGLTVAYAVEDSKIIGSEYEVVYTDRTQVDFDNNGEWSSVERRYEAVPAAIVPEQIRNYLAGSSYPNAYITKIDRDKYAWEVELSNGLEIKFDRQFRVVEIDD